MIRLSSATCMLGTKNSASVAGSWVGVDQNDGFEAQAGSLDQALQPAAL